MLYLIGTGIYNENLSRYDIIEILNNSDYIYIDTYTSPIDVYSLVKELTAIGISKEKIIVAYRRILEDEVDNIIKEAKTKDIVILVPGNPFIATTHNTLVSTAKKLGIKIGIIHGSSAICSSIAESGLHIYKFGGFATVVRREKCSSYRAYELIKSNRRRGFHTLILLEYDHETGYMMKPDEAIRILKEYGKLLDKDDLIIVICNLGKKNKKILPITISELNKIKWEDNDICILIIPGDLHFTEKEYLNLIRSELGWRKI